MMSEPATARLDQFLAALSDHAVRLLLARISDRDPRLVEEALEDRHGFPGTAPVAETPARYGCDQYADGCGCPKCSFITAVDAFTRRYTGHNSAANSALVLAEAAKALNA